jgi:hypothetical protein
MMNLVICEIFFQELREKENTKFLYKIPLNQQFSAEEREREREKCVTLLFYNIRKTSFTFLKKKEVREIFRIITSW